MRPFPDDPLSSSPGYDWLNGMSAHVLRALRLAAALSLAPLLSATASVAGDGALDAVRTRGQLICGVGDGPRGFSSVDRDGTWSGIGVDFCRALAAAVIGDRDAVKFLAVSGGDHLSALRSGRIDVLARRATMTSSRDTSLAIRYPVVLAFDGQGFMVRKSQGVASALELSGARICGMSATADAQGIADYFGGLKMPFELTRYERWEDAVMAYANKTCQVLSADLSMLALARQQSLDPGDHIILPEMATRHLVGPVIRQGDEAWFSVVRWTVYALIAAEELGITAANVDAMRASGTPEARRFLGVEMELSRQLGLSTDWTQHIVKQVGSYGELFERNLGLKSALKLERGLNNLSSKGGLLYAPPFR